MARASFSFSFASVSVALAALALLACGEPAAPAVDAAVADAAMPEDAALTPDASEVCGTIPAGRITPLPAACMPRCTAATFAAYRACTTTACVPPVLEADPTPPVIVGAAAGPIVVGCGRTEGVGWTCLQWQLFAVAAALCPGSYDIWAHCATDGSACTAESNALVTCAQADPAFNAMFTDLVTMCFAPS